MAQTVGDVEERLANDHVALCDITNLGAAYHRLFALLRAQC